ncbi:MAG: hypothetical protein M3O06_06230, partial [Pseudomonadota bacterium]|nr:hypothetical protein [Pseudomonadota bacterium]
REVDLTLLDRQAVVSGDTLNAYAELGWRVTVQCIDVRDWAARTPATRYDLCLANLFLHHFERAPLAGLLRGIAAAADAFIACEPRRSGLARLGSRLIGLLGVNAVTRDDAVKSVAAGFDGRELTCAWEAAGIAGWHTDEHFAPPFTHCFSAVRGDDRPSSS